MFDRLYQIPTHRLFEVKPTISGTASDRMKKLFTHNDSKVEDRLIKYGKTKTKELEQKRAEAKKLELSQLQVSPRILDNAMTQRQKSPHHSVLERFEEMERERQRKLPEHLRADIALYT